MNMEMLSNLFTRYLNNECSAKEIDQLLQHFKIPEDEGKLKELIISSFDKDGQDTFSEDEEKKLSIKLSLLYERIKLDIEKEPSEGVKIKPLIKWISIAAGIALLCCSGLLYQRFNNKNNNTSGEIAYSIKPGGNKAFLVLSTGEQLDLNQVKNGIVAKQGSVNIYKDNDGQLSYSGAAHDNITPATYNSIEVPRGGQYHVILHDGTYVWLNSGSTLKYPTNFNEKTRNVTLTGEAYFEVAKNKEQPFIVNVKNINVQVVGTHFNIMAYDNEQSINTTLLEGAIKVSTNTESKMVIPGQEAIINNNIHLVNANVEEVVAWKNAAFLFKNTDIQSVMRQIERWYNVEVIYIGEKPLKHFNGKISRDTDIKKLLAMLEGTGGVHFKISQNRIIVSQ